ncbi:NUDIX hydrolase [Plebeiibacterium sediminum]|uniref:NUDIX hydrolase n=1 Tax=Plebeiibacterium sediminum TaxID=2992112 RepID=A0AAE3M2S1_9BACT|nr:NUDIX hydrolase [Plebeiobacterium sediminum]MCW3785695.1 NUDIX hydrolase [Plebeiobacterium sediminum]
MSYNYEYPRPAVTVDVILVTEDSIPEILLIQRKNNPYQNLWALPGGFLDMDEDLETAAKRELQEETSVDGVEIKQFKSYGAPDRDPRGRTVSVVYYAFVKEKPKAVAMDDAKDASWFKISNLPELAFDHQLILEEFKKEILK